MWYKRVPRAGRCPVSGIGRIAPGSRGVVVMCFLCIGGTWHRACLGRGAVSLFSASSASSPDQEDNKKGDEDCRDGSAGNDTG